MLFRSNYEEFLWSKKTRATAASAPPAPPLPPPGGRSANSTSGGVRSAIGQKGGPDPRKVPKADLTPKPSYDAKKQQDAEARKTRKEVEARQRRIQELEGRIAKAEQGIKELEAQMSAPGFYENHAASKPILDRHQALMWEVGDLMNKWEALQAQTEV